MDNEIWKKKRITICGFYSQNHSLHTIIKRQISTYQEIGWGIVIIDQLESNEEICELNYVRIVIRQVKLNPFRKIIWKILRPLAAGRLSEAYWTALLCMEHLLTSIKFAKAALGIDASIYQAHDIWSLLAVSFTKAFRKIPIVYDAHELASEQGNPSSIYNGCLRFLERKLIPGSDLILMPNRSRASLYKEKFKLRNEPIVILNCPPYINIEKSNRLHKLLGLPERDRIVVYHGALIPGRALEEMIRSVEYFDRDIHLVIIGDQNVYFDQVLRPISESLRTNNKVHFLPYMPYDQVIHYVASADLGIVIYKNINLNNFFCAPSKMYEYVMLDLPFVGSNFPEIQDFLEAYPVGETFNPEEPKSIADTVNNYLSKLTTNIIDIHNQLELARKRFTWEKEEVKLIEALSSLIE